MEYGEKKKGNPHGKGKGMAVTIMMGMPVSKKGTGRFSKYLRQMAEKLS